MVSLSKNKHFHLIKWTILYFIFGVVFFSCSKQVNNPYKDERKFDYTIKRHDIIVDGNIDDWKTIDSVEVKNKEKLWIGEGLSDKQWAGNDDLSFTWKACYFEGKLFFLIRVKDDTLSSFNQEYAWLNDCVEIHLDHQYLKGHRIIGIGPENSLEDRLGKRLNGHEMQFLPCNPPKVFYDDSKKIYYTDSAQTNSFIKEWHGDIASLATKDGYLLEIGFAIPNFYIQPGQKIGLDIAVCDDDGIGRKSLMISSGFQGQFWLTMDEFLQVEIQ